MIDCKGEERDGRDCFLRHGGKDVFEPEGAYEQLFDEDDNDYGDCESARVILITVTTTTATNVTIAVKTMMTKTKINTRRR